MTQNTTNHARADVLDELERAVINPDMRLADALRACLMLSARTRAAGLRDWATAELRGYPGYEVPEYRKIRAPIMQAVQSPSGRFAAYLFNPNSVPEAVRHDFSDIVPLNQGVDALEALVDEHQAQQKQIELSHYASEPYNRVWANSPNRAGSMVALYWSIYPAAVRGVLGEIRTALAEFVTNLRFEMGNDDQLPSGAQTDETLRAIVGSAVFNSPVTIVATGQSGDIVTDQSRNEYNFGGVKGNVAAGSSNFSQLYNDSSGLTEVRKFVDFVAEVNGILGLDPSGQAELEGDTGELRAALDERAKDRGRIRRAVDAVMRTLKLAADTAVRNAAITMGDQAARELDAIIHHLPH